MLRLFGIYLGSRRQQQAMWLVRPGEGPQAGGIGGRVCSSERVRGGRRGAGGILRSCIRPCQVWKLLMRELV